MYRIHFLPADACTLADAYRALLQEPLSIARVGLSMLGSHREGELMTNTEQRPSMTLTVGATADNAVQKSAPTFAVTWPEDVFGALPYRGKPKSIARMDAGILAEAKRRHVRD